jgi:hypothetical protein
MGVCGSKGGVIHVPALGFVDSDKRWRSSANPALNDANHVDDLKAVQDALALWEVAKTQCFNSYTYSVPQYYDLDCNLCQTEIQVIDGMVYKRRMHKWAPAGQHDGYLEPGWIEWEETSRQIGVHSDAAPAKTLDQLYADCSCEDIARQEVGGSIFREMRINADGLLLSCHLKDLEGPDYNPNLIDGEDIENAYSKLNVSKITLGGTLLPLWHEKMHRLFARPS